MKEILKSHTFSDWLVGLKDIRAKMRILARVDRIAEGNFGDVKPVGNGVSECRIDYGPGYRVYFIQKGRQIVVLLCGGDKSTQDKDIKLALQLARSWEEQHDE
ncbi:type II toxin-antitoxin system RelE/ParE family toxin [Photorhabdus temperata]|nr:type II toxin-antitoxin system RelE/ParE family toxin [Photorhabdus temperata]EQC00362.1 hypothetical protein B738_11275 [Photorhabdus temperata subsp. temperata M1021]KER04013.1 putative addiction module killer protein [Photorhabdus temperata subsp. temperata Meg1]MCT8347695.1 type II toxin-antitoxin system RelE/ParE family toxin [Photorhabdus temperata]